MVKSKLAKDKNLNKSLFYLLHQLHGDTATVKLHKQYRMNEDIMTLCNVLKYQEKLTCGSSRVAKVCVCMYECR